MFRDVTYDVAAAGIVYAVDNGARILSMSFGGTGSSETLEAALEYAERLRPVAERHQDALCILMRTYFEKPRTTVGWKGLINDPHMNGSFEIEEGLEVSLLEEVVDAMAAAAAEAGVSIVAPRVARKMHNASAQPESSR